MAPLSTFLAPLALLGSLLVAHAAPAPARGESHRVLGVPIRNADVDPVTTGVDEARDRHEVRL